METLITTYTLFITSWFFVLGVAIGSFLNVVVLRFEAGEALTGRSRCPKCGRTLSWYELIPIVSYLVQRGKCRGCRERISPQYPLVEFATGILFALVFLVHATAGAFSYAWSFTAYLLIAVDLTVWSNLIAIAVYDLRTKEMPDTMLFLVALGALASSFLAGNLTLSWVLAGPAVALPFLLLSLGSRERLMGLGDGKLALGMGWLLGFEHGGSAVILAFWLGAAVSLAVMFYQYLRARFITSSTGESITLKTAIPFGPFLVLGTLYVYLFGWSIVSFIY